MEFLQDHAAEAIGRQVQVIVSTHSPNLASKVKLASMILVSQGRGFPMGPEYTLLSPTDYIFLERFLDVTKANLFFARGVLIVEGDAESLLLPSLARFLGRELTRYGISIVNVGSRGLRRYARIFRRKPLFDGAPTPCIPVRVACIADRDVRPECARDVLGGDTGTRRPIYEADLADDAARKAWLDRKRRDDGENVCTFVSDHWTLEYDLALSGLGCSLYEAIALAEKEKSLDRSEEALTNEERFEVESRAEIAWRDLKQLVGDRNDAPEYLAYKVYEPLLKGVSKPMVAQHLATILATKPTTEVISSIPNYIRNAIEYVTGSGLFDDKIRE
jgi:putative ATP-dependent endonuclease of OLD family